MDKVMNKLLLSLVAISGLIACQANDEVIRKTGNDVASIERQADAAQQELDRKMIQQWQKGKIVFNVFEGGFFGIITDSGEKLLPMNLTNQYRQVGAIVKFKGKKNKDVMTTKQWGTSYTIEAIELISKGKSSNDSTLY